MKDVIRMKKRKRDKVWIKFLTHHSSYRDKERQAESEILILRKIVKIKVKILWTKKFMIRGNQKICCP